MSARLAAFNILNDILFQKKSMDEAFERSPLFHDLSGRDRGFVKVLVTTVLKRAPEMDAVLVTLLREPMANLKPPQLLNVFRLGIAQLVFLETPSHAAVSETVDLSEEAGIAHHKPLVNAVMRRIAAEGYPKHYGRDAGRVNTPHWLWQTWVNDYGVEVALDIAAANLNEAPVDFTVKADPDKWAERLNARLLPGGSLRRDSAGFVPELPGFDEGEWWIQNAAAAVPARLFSDLRDKVVIDLCAAPGGKTAQLAAAGAKVIAVDRSSNRINILKENMARLKYDVTVVSADGAVWQPSEKVDAVLLDAPCTATGTIRHQPDVLWLKDLRDQEKLAALQRRLMVNAAAMLKPGGELVYCTCSLQKAEGEEQAAWLMEQELGLEQLAVMLPGLTVAPVRDVRIMPQQWADTGGIDGFYVAVFRKSDGV